MCIEMHLPRYWVAWTPTKAYFLFTHEIISSQSSHRKNQLLIPQSTIVHGIKAIQNYSIARLDESELVSRYVSSNVFDRASWSIPTTHTFHPQYHPEYPRFKTASPILVLSTTYDPICPLVSAKKAHDSFEGAGFVEQKSYGHCSISMPSLCTAKHVKAYFNDGTLPEKSAT
jgi:hypothetical protein